MKKFYIEPEFDCLLLSSLEDILTSNTSVELPGTEDVTEGNTDVPGMDEDWNDDENWE